MSVCKHVKWAYLGVWPCECLLVHMHDCLFASVLGGIRVCVFARFFFAHTGTSCGPVHLCVHAGAHMICAQVSVLGLGKRRKISDGGVLGT